MNTNFEGGANFNVLVKTFQKNALNAKTWSNPFFGRNMVFLVLSESSENQFGRPKKADTIFKFFLKPPPPPPLEKILDPPLNKIFRIFRKTASFFQKIISAHALGGVKNLFKQAINSQNCQTFLSVSLQNHMHNFQI